jgi:DNA replication protein DnaC
MLIVDDLGAVKKSAWMQETFFKLFNSRYNHCRPTIITADVSDKQLQDALSLRVYDRIATMSKGWQVIVGGANLRHTGVK